MNVGINLSKVKDPWMVLAHILKAEPYLERIAADFPKSKPMLHFTSPEPFPIETFFDIFREEATTREIAWHPTPEELDRATAFEFNTALDAHYIKRPYRPTPCLGRQDWARTVQRPKSVVFVLERTNQFESLTGMDSDAIVTHATSGSIQHTVRDIMDADMVVTDHCGVALFAAAASVNRVTCLEVAGDPDVLEGVPGIKRFRRRSGDENSMYEAMFRFAYNEWSGYERYPKIMNQGDAQRFIQPLALQWCRGYGIDVGSNQWPFPGAIRCDIENRAEAWAKAPFDFVFSSHCLEHIKDWETELKLWRDSLKPDGIMFCYVPHPLCEVWLPEGDWVRGGWHVWSPDPITLYRHVRFNLGMEVLQYSSRPDPYWGFHLIARKP